MKIQAIKQRDASACGPTCIEMALKYFNIPHTVSKIAEVTNYKQREGMYNLDIVAALKAFGLKTKIRKNASWEDLKKENRKDTVVILSWMLDGYIGHVSVLERLDSKYIYLAEPTKGKTVKMEKIKFLRLWLDYEAKGKGVWYPKKNSDIQLRWMVAVSR
jgi:ABC-type bacteriocin/lantibiotic exporter with double-glycine peptidase domain